jgi:hypothetical protein
MRVIGTEIHRTFAQVAILNDGKFQDHSRFVMERDAVLAFAVKVLRASSRHRQSPPGSYYRAGQSKESALQKFMRPRLAWRCS